MRGKLAVLFNPKAGTAAQLAALRDRLTARPNTDLYEARSADDMARLARQVAQAGYDVVAIAGGDGTVHTVVNALGPRFPRVLLAVLPLGTGNDLCRTLAVPLDPIAALDLIDTGAGRPIDIIEVSGAKKGFLINVATGGFSGRVAADVTSELKEAWGPFAYVRGAAGPMAEREGYRLSLRFDQRKWEHHQCLNIVVANARTAAGGFSVAPTARPDDGRLDVVMVLAGDVLELSVVAAKLMAGDYLSDEHVTHRRATRLELVAEQPIAVSLDGEVCEGTHFTFTVRKHALRFIVGPDYVSKVLPDDEGDDVPAPEPTGAGRVRQRFFGLLGAVLQLGIRLPRFYVVGLVTALATLLIFAWLTRGTLAGEWSEWNREVSQRWSEPRSPALDNLAETVTWLGGAGVTSLVSLSTLAYLLIRRRYLDSATMLAVVLGLILLELVLKPAFAVPRPNPVEALTHAGGFAFPSGHTMRSVGLYGYLMVMMILHRPGSAWRWIVAGLMLPLILSVGWSRVYLQVHSPTDVLAGGLAAIFWVSSCLMARHSGKQWHARRLDRRRPTG